jgi:hypothetical protein
MFFARGLDRANHVELSRQIVVLAQRSWSWFDGRLWPTHKLRNAVWRNIDTVARSPGGLLRDVNPLGRLAAHYVAPFLMVASFLFGEKAADMIKAELRVI